MVESHVYGRIAMHFYNYYVFLLDLEADALRIQSPPRTSENRPRQLRDNPGFLL